jgi:hypothetical protein
MTYTEKLHDPRWQKKRLEVFTRDNFTCQLCKDTETELQVHHKKYIGWKDPWDYANELLITLCRDCHGYMYNDKELPFKIIKRHVEADVILIVIRVDGQVAFYRRYENLILSDTTVREVFHAVIDFWLQSDNEHNLIDKYTILKNV